MLFVSGRLGVLAVFAGSFSLDDCSVLRCVCSVLRRVAVAWVFLPVFFSSTAAVCLQRLCSVCAVCLRCVAGGLSLYGRSVLQCVAVCCGVFALCCVACAVDSGAVECVAVLTLGGVAVSAVEVSRVAGVACLRSCRPLAGPAAGVCAWCVFL